MKLWQESINNKPFSKIRAGQNVEGGTKRLNQNMTFSDLFDVVLKVELNSKGSLKQIFM